MYNFVVDYNLRNGSITGRKGKGIYDEKLMAFMNTYPADIIGTFEDETRETVMGRPTIKLSRLKLDSNIVRHALCDRITNNEVV